MICVGSINDKIMGKTKYVQTYLDPEEKSTIRINTKLDNMFMNGVRLLNPGEVTQTLNIIERTRIIKTCNHPIQTKNGISTYNIDRSKDKFVKDYTFKDSEYEAVNFLFDEDIIGDDIYEEYFEDIDYKYKMTELSYGQIFIKPYLANPDEFTIRIKMTNSIKFRINIPIMMGEIIIENYEKLLSFYIKMQDHFFDNINMHENTFNNALEYVRTEHDDYEIQFSYSKKLKEFSSKLILYKDDVIVLEDEKILDASHTILHYTNFNMNIIFLNYELKPAGFDFEINNCTSLLLYENEDLGDLFLHGYTDRNDLLEFRINHEHLTEKYDARNNNIFFNMSAKTRESHTTRLKHKDFHTMNRGNDFELCGLEYHLYSISNYFTTNSNYTMSFILNNMRSFILSDIQLIDLESTKYVNYEVKFNESNVSMEILLQNNTNHRTFFAYNRSSKGGNREDLINSGLMTARMNDKARHILSTIRYDATNLKFYGLEIKIAQTVDVNLKSFTVGTTYDSWNDETYNDNYVVYAEDFDLLFNYNLDYSYRINGLIKPLSKIPKFNHIKKGAYIYGYRIIMDYNDKVLAFTDITFDKPYVYNLDHYVPVNIHLLLHGDVVK